MSSNRPRSSRPTRWATAIGTRPTRPRSRRCAQTLDTVPIDGTIVIGEGERDEAPMLYIGEKVGKAHAAARRRDGERYPRSTSPSIRSKGRTCAAPGAPNALAVLAASDEGGLLHAPDLYMEKLVVGRDAQARRVPRRAGRAQPARHRQGAGAPGRGPGDLRARPAAPRRRSSPTSGRRAHASS